MLFVVVVVMCYAGQGTSLALPEIADTANLHQKMMISFSIFTSRKENSPGKSMYSFHDKMYYVPECSRYW